MQIIGNKQFFYTYQHVHSLRLVNVTLGGKSINHVDYKLLFTHNLGGFQYSALTTTRTRNDCTSKCYYS